MYSPNKRTAAFDDPAPGATSTPSRRSETCTRPCTTLPGMTFLPPHPAGVPPAWVLKEHSLFNPSFCHLRVCWTQGEAGRVILCGLVPGGTGYLQVMARPRETASRGGQYLTGDWQPQNCRHASANNCASVAIVPVDTR